MLFRSPTFSGQIWDVIRTNRDLDLPNQREALATYRCEDISEELYNDFLKNITLCSEQLKNGSIVENFGSLVYEHMDTCLSQFSQKTVNYQEDVVKRKSTKLSDLLMMNLKDLFNKQINLIREHSLRLFQKLIKEEFNEKEIYPNFGAMIKN